MKRKTEHQTSKRNPARPRARAEVVSLADEESVRQVVAESVLSLWDVVNSLTRLRPSRQERYRVTIFGSARLSPHLEDAPLVLVGEMWPRLVAWARHEMLASDPPLAGRADFDIPRCVPDADAAIEAIRGHYERWKLANGHSSRGRAARARSNATTQQRRTERKS